MWKIKYFGRIGGLNYGLDFPADNLNHCALCSVCSPPLGD